MKKKVLMFSICLLMGACAQNGGDNKSYKNNNRTHDNQDCDQSSDWEITGRVKKMIMMDSTLSTSARFVSVETNDGVVTLTGSVPTKEDSRRIERMTKDVQGVQRVRNELTINP